MGFGAYDESDQDEQDVDYDDDNAVSIDGKDGEEDNEIGFDYGGKSMSELVEQADTPDAEEEADETEEE